MKRLSALIGLAVLFVASGAFAYTTIKTSYGKQKKWTYAPVTYHLASTCDPKQSDKNACLGALRNGFARWSKVSCSTMKFVEGTAGTRISSSDGDNTVGWLTSWPQNYGDDALAVTLPVSNEYTGEMYDADISFNPNKVFSTNNTTDTTDLESVITHEAGHLQGLDHSQTVDATMYYATGPNEIFRRSLESDDLQGICSIYGNGKAVPPECATNADCSSYETCNGGQCSGGLGAGARVYGQTCDQNNNCTKQFKCVGGFPNNTNECTQDCDPAKPTTCPNGDVCGQLTGGGGACIPGTAPAPAEFGAPCNTNVNCISRSCAKNPADGKNYCSVACDPKAPATCPKNFFCGFTTPTAGNCFAGSPPSNLKAVGVECSIDTECVTAFCASSLTDQTKKYCAQVCDSVNRCPSNTLCKLVTPSRGVCRPGELGDTCASGDVCAGHLCVTDKVDPSVKYCSHPCGACPTGYVCENVGGSLQACVKPPPPGTKNFGEACGGDGECASNLCGPDKTCTHTCGSCESGYACTQANGESICTKAADTGGGGDDSGGGCGCQSTSAAGSLMLLFALGVLVVRRSSRSPRT